MNKNKNFRKSAIVIPALALMVLTAAAGTTGAVAWFTATRSVNANVSEFTAVNPSGNLALSATAGVGTAVSSSDNTTVTPATNKDNKSNVLTDASYDLKNHKLYSDYVSEDGAPTTFEDVTASKLTMTSAVSDPSAYAAGTLADKTSYYYAFSWSYTISLNANNTGKDTFLFFDPKNSTVTGASSEILPGFRLAIDTTTDGATAYQTGAKGQTDGHKMILSSATVVEGKNFITSTDGANGSYGSSDDTFTGCTKYVAGQSLDLYSDGLPSETATGYGNYLGKFAANAATASITVYVTAWFEGQDPAVINKNANQVASAKLSFYARSVA